MQSTSSQILAYTPFDADRKNVNELLGALVEFLEGRPNAKSDSVTETLEEILLDVDLGGHRYLLIRMSAPGNGRVHLSPREWEIARMVAKGHPNKVIADVLNISSWTVCTHLRRMFAKLGVTSRAAMVAHLLETERPAEVAGTPEGACSRFEQARRCVAGDP